jgi:subtilisin family serine protease
MPKLEELHIEGPDELKAFRSSYPQVKIVYIDETNTDPFTALSRGLPLAYAAKKASGRLTSLFTLEPRGEPTRLYTAHKPAAERLRELACTKLFASNAARLAALKQIKIGILDSGVNWAHPDLAGTIAATAIFVDSEISCLDVIGHGTHCAGIIAGARTGVACGVQLYVAKVADQH